MKLLVEYLKNYCKEAEIVGHYKVKHSFDPQSRESMPLFAVKIKTQDDSQDCILLLPVCYRYYLKDQGFTMEAMKKYCDDRVKLEDQAEYIWLKDNLNDSNQMIGFVNSIGHPPAQESLDLANAFIKRCVAPYTQEQIPQDKIRKLMEEVFNQKPFCDDTMEHEWQASYSLTQYSIFSIEKLIKEIRLQGTGIEDTRIEDLIFISLSYLMKHLQYNKPELFVNDYQSQIVVFRLLSPFLISQIDAESRVMSLRMKEAFKPDWSVMVSIIFQFPSRLSAAYMSNLLLSTCRCKKHDEYCKKCDVEATEAKSSSLSINQWNLREPKGLLLGHLTKVLHTYLESSLRVSKNEDRLLLSYVDASECAAIVNIHCSQMEAQIISMSVARFFNEMNCIAKNDLPKVLIFTVRDGLDFEKSRKLPQIYAHRDSQFDKIMEDVHYHEHLEKSRQQEIYSQIMTDQVKEKDQLIRTLKDLIVDLEKQVGPANQVYALVQRFLNQQPQPVEQVQPNHDQQPVLQVRESDERRPQLQENALQAQDQERDHNNQPSQNFQEDENLNLRQDVVEASPVLPSQVANNDERSDNDQQEQAYSQVPDQRDERPLQRSNQESVVGVPSGSPKKTAADHLFGTESLDEEMKQEDEEEEKKEEEPTTVQRIILQQLHQEHSSSNANGGVSSSAANSQAQPQVADLHQDEEMKSSSERGSDDDEDESSDEKEVEEFEEDDESSSPVYRYLDKSIKVPKDAYSTLTQRIITTKNLFPINRQERQFKGNGMDMASVLSDIFHQHMGAWFDQYSTFKRRE